MHSVSQIDYINKMTRWEGSQKKSTQENILICKPRFCWCLNCICWPAIMFMPIVMHLQNYTFFRWIVVFIFFIFLFSSSSKHNKAAHEWRRRCIASVAHSWNCSRCLCKCVYCMSLLSIILYLFVSLVFFSLSFANCEMDKWTNTHLK